VPFSWFTVPASSQTSIAFTATTTQGYSNQLIVGPSGYVVIGMTNGSSVGYGYTYGGSCSVTFTTF
jgi:hypothetical protein